MHVLFLEAYYGGSHRDFADGYREYSGHRITIESMPARFWKWRMRGAALTFAHRLSPHPFDVVIATSMMSVADLKSCWGADCPPVLLYMHENQIAYPVSDDDVFDLQYGFTEIASCLAAENVLFNSLTHRDTYLRTLPAFIRRMPDFRLDWAPEQIAAKSDVFHPGCRFSARVSADPDARPGTSAVGVSARGDSIDHQVPVILWNHRWEFDKQPDVFFRALYRLKDEGQDFRVIVAGEAFRDTPSIFDQARTLLSAHILHFGYAHNKDAYTQLLAKSDIVVSTAIQENFGIAVMEAMRFGCIPILPERLSYPEILPPAMHRQCLYEVPVSPAGKSAVDAEVDAVAHKLRDTLSMLQDSRQAADVRSLRAQLQAHAAVFSWERRAPLLDDIVSALAEQREDSSG